MWYLSSWRDLRRHSNAGHGLLNKPEITPPSHSYHCPDGTPWHVPPVLHRLQSARVVTPHCGITIVRCGSTIVYSAPCMPGGYISRCCRHFHSYGSLYRSPMDTAPAPVSTRAPIPVTGPQGSAEAVEPRGVVDQDLVAHRGIRGPFRQLVQDPAVVDRKVRGDLLGRALAVGVGMRP